MLVIMAQVVINRNISGVEQKISTAEAGCIYICSNKFSSVCVWGGGYAP